MTEMMSWSADPDHVMTVQVDATGVVRLSWAEGLQITGRLAQQAMGLVDMTNVDRERPLLVDMRGTATLSRDARMVFRRKCSASRIALLGRSPVDRVLANFAMSVGSVPVPTRFFTSELAAVTWLRDGDPTPA